MDLRAADAIERLIFPVEHRAVEGKCEILDAAHVGLLQTPFPLGLRFQEGADLLLQFVQLFLRRFRVFDLKTHDQVGDFQRVGVLGKSGQHQGRLNLVGRKFAAGPTAKLQRHRAVAKSPNHPLRQIDEIDRASIGAEEDLVRRDLLQKRQRLLDFRIGQGGIHRAERAFWGGGIQRVHRPRLLHEGHRLELRPRPALAHRREHLAVAKHGVVDGDIVRNDLQRDGRLGRLSGRGLGRRAEDHHRRHGH